MASSQTCSHFFFFNDTATTEIYTLSLHDALPICRDRGEESFADPPDLLQLARGRSEEHTSELQSRFDLVCRLLLEKKNKLWRCVSRCRQWNNVDVTNVYAASE